MPIRTFLLTKLMLLLMIPITLILPFIFIYKDNQIALTVLTVIVIVLITFPYIGIYSRKYYVYEDHVIVQTYFKKILIAFEEIDTIDELEHGFEMTFKNGTKVTYVHKGMFKRDSHQLYELLHRLITKAEFSKV